MIGDRRFQLSVQPPRPPGRNWKLALTVTPDYFRAMGTPLLRGRVFNPTDTKDSQPVIIVNDLLRNVSFRRQRDRPANRFDSRPTAASLPISLPPPKEIVACWRLASRSLASNPCRNFTFSVPGSAASGWTSSSHDRERSGRTSDFIAKYCSRSSTRIWFVQLEPLEKRIGVTLSQPRFNMLLLGAFRWRSP